MGQCINNLSRSCNHTALGEHQFQDNVLPTYQKWTMNLQEKNYGCVNNKPFTLQHTLEWKVQGLLMGRHNEVWNYHSIMETRAFSYYIYDKPVISPCWYVTGTHSYQYLMESKGQTNNITSGECFELNGWYLDISSMATPDWHHNLCQGDVQRLKIIPVSHSGQHSKKTGE